MRCTWLISADVSGQTPTEWDCPLASVRYRVLAPARYLAAQGHQVGWLRIDQAAATPSEPATAARLAADVVVISKVLSHGSLDVARAAQRSGAKVLVDLCDDHFDTPELSGTYFALCELTDGILASTAAMTATIRRRTGRAAIQIDDPFEGPHGPPRYSPREQYPAVKLAWFGHPVNFDTILAMLPGLQSLTRELPLELSLVTDVAAAQRSPLWQSLNAARQPGLKLELIPWSLAATWQTLADSDLVVLPSLPEQKKQVKSPNRAVEGIRAGRLVLAYPLPAYQELAGGLWLGEDLAAGIRWAVAHPSEARQLIERGQTLIVRRFAQEQVGRSWEAVLEQVAECEPLTV